MTIHSRIPQILRRKTGYIGEPPLANEIGLALAKDFHYLNCWAQNYQLFSFWQPALDPNHGDQCVATTQIAYCDGNYYVILCSPPKIDTSNPQRSLQGALLPWASMGFKTVGGGLDWEEWPTITWQQTGEAAETLYDNKASSLEVSADLAKDKRLPWKNPIMLGGAGQFLWTPDAAGGFTWGVLTTHQIRTAALGIWPGPDWDLTAAQARFNTAKFAQGHGIRGYTTTAAKNSLGNIVHTKARPKWTTMIFIKTRGAPASCSGDTRKASGQITARRMLISGTRTRHTKRRRAAGAIRATAPRFLWRTSRQLSRSPARPLEIPRIFGSFPSPGPTA
jgi:hypothetical protein